MTDAECIAYLEAELAREREEKARLLVLLEFAITPKQRGQSAVRMERKRIRDAESKAQNVTSSVTTGVTVTQNVTHTPPSPPLDGSPLSPAPSLPSPLSSPQPLFPAAYAPVAPEVKANESKSRPALVLAHAQPDSPTEKPRRSRRSKANPEPTGDPRHAPLVLAIVEAHREAKGAPYGFQGGKDARAVSDLLMLADQDPATQGEAAPAEILRRWGIAIRWRGFPACTGLLAFRDNWNAYIREHDAKQAGDRPRLGPAPEAKPALTGDRPRL